MKKLFLFLIFILFYVSCFQDKKNMDAERKKLDDVCFRINKDFQNLIPEIDSTANFIQQLYSKDSVAKTLRSVDKKQYVVSKEGILYRKNYDNTSAVFVSGYIPINEEIKNIIYFTEPLDGFFKEIVRKNKEVVQIYYNDKNSYNRIYPGFDVLSQYQVKMNIPSFNFYYLADEKHNPSKAAVWVKDPYVDPAGRGWMISLIKPVYVNGIMEGVPGIDITISDIVGKYLTEGGEDIVIVSGDGVIVAISEKIATLLSLPPLKDHKYIETIKSDTYLSDNFNLLKSKQPKVRSFSEEIIKNKKSEAKYSFENENYTVISSEIDSLGWIGIKFIKQK